MAKKPLTFKSMPNAGEDASFSFFMPISKIDKKKRTVSGYASTPTRDMDGEIIPLDAIKAALPDYMQWRNIREMHRQVAVGTTQEANVDSKGLYITAKIVDENAWTKCAEGVYKGFSIGGRKIEKSGDTITDLELIEISIVDRPANPDCRIEIVKAAKSGQFAFSEDVVLVETKAKDPSSRALKKMAQAVQILAKSNIPAARDGLSLPNGPTDNRSPKDNEIQSNKGGDKPGEGKFPYGDVEYADPGYQADKKKRYPLSSKKKVRAAWGYIHHATNRAKYDAEQVTQIESKIRGAAKKYDIELDTDKKAQKKVAKAMRANKAAGAMVKYLAPMQELDGKSKPKAFPELMSLGEARDRVGSQPTHFSPDFLELGKAAVVLPSPDLKLGFVKPEKSKSMSTIMDLAMAFNQIRNAQRSLLREESVEHDGKDKDLAKQLGTAAQMLAAIIGQKATHEGAEALDLSDADDLWIMQLLGEDFEMNARNGGGAESISKALVASLLGGGDETLNIDDIIKAARKSDKNSPMGRMKKAKKAVDDMKECRKSIKGAVENLHGMCKAAYLAKQAHAELVKAGKKPKDGDDDDSDFDFGKAMGILNKAYGDVETMKSLMKAAGESMDKAIEGRSGQRGQEAGDGMAGVYEVPPGVRDLSPRNLATASPGGRESGSAPPMYPGDGSVYPGKNAKGFDLRKYARKDGTVPVEIAELIGALQSLEGQNEVLLAATNRGGRPHMFDMRKLGNGGFGMAEGGNQQKEFAALFKGINPADLSSPDDNEQRKAAATIAGRMLLSPNFGKSVMDTDFRGTAGISTQ